MKKPLTHKQIMSRRFKCDDGIWRGVLKYIPASSSYVLIMKGKNGNTRFQEVKASWFGCRESEVKAHV